MSINQKKTNTTVVALAGRRTDALYANIQRFPLSSVSKVQSKLRSLFIERKIQKIVCSAACGADLVALDIAGSLGLERHIIIPFSVSEFRRISVTDRPGDWGPLYDQIISEALAQDSLYILDYDSDDNSAFSMTNKAIIEKAKLLANGEIPLAIGVWEGYSSGTTDATREFIELAKEANFDSENIPSI